MIKYSDIKLNISDVEKIAKLSYFAGIIDGEGSIGLEHLSPTKGRIKSYYVARMVVVNTNENLMKLLLNFFGGAYSTRPLIQNRKKCFIWRVLGKNLDNALKLLTPHLFIKKPQALLLQEYRATVGKTGWNVSDELLETRKQLWLKCKELNKLG